MMRNSKQDDFGSDMRTSMESPGKQRTTRSADSLMSSWTQEDVALGANALTVALIGPQQQARTNIAKSIPGAQAGVVREFSSYPELDDLPKILKSDYDVIIVELDTNAEYALDLVEHICGNSSATVMVYSALKDSELLVRCMRAGAREFLNQPVAPATLAEAMVRASVRRSSHRPAKRTEGQLLVFLGAKGGSGVSTLASNFAVALAGDSHQNAALLDLNFPLGNTAIDLGLSAPLSAADALKNLDRLDANFLSTVMIKHSSGLSVLAAPDHYTPLDVRDEAIEKLVSVVRQSFDYVVVDAGAGMTQVGRVLLNSATTVYLVLQVNLPELRNANRLISAFFRSETPQLEIVLNRFNQRAMEIDEESITKALTTAAKWKIPSDYVAMRKAQNTASPVALNGSPISQVLLKMARSASGQADAADKKKRFSIFGLS
jgi:pilus assembly protein CpaE